QHRQQTEQTPHQPVDQRQQHLEMIPATALTSQQNPSSQHKTEFPSGTGFEPARLRLHDDGSDDAPPLGRVNG
ncbi:MAG TPA: hypothetical protein VGP24_10270, partial [Glaciihabitans sp.]|nr:hypothetical protein [Glaciihabitans sp.]